MGDKLMDTLEAALDQIEAVLDAASVDYWTGDTPNANQYIIVYADGERRAYVTAELSWDDNPIVFVDIYSVDADGGERWVCGDMNVDAAVLYIIND